MERDPWWKNVTGPFPDWGCPVGCKEDGGGCHRASGWVGKMVVHRAVHNRDAAGALASLLILSVWCCASFLRPVSYIQQPSTQDPLLPLCLLEQKLPRVLERVDF